MKNKLLSILSLFLAIPLMASCGNKPKDNPQDDSHNEGPTESGYNDSAIIPENFILETPQWCIEREQLNAFNDVAQFHSKVDKDVPVNYTVYLELNDNTPEGFNDFDTYFSIANSAGIEYALEYAHVTEKKYSVTPEVGAYEPGRFYTATIEDNAPFHFFNKDKEVKEFHFNTHGEDVSVYKHLESVIELDLNEVIAKKSIDEVTSKEDELWVRTRKQVNLQPGEVFLFKYEKLDRHAFYGKCTRLAVENDQYFIYYVAPSMTEIFGGAEDTEHDLNIYCQNYVPDELNDLVLCSEKSIHDDIANSVMIRDIFHKGYNDYARAHGGLEASAKTWIEVMKDVRIIPKFGFSWPGWSFSLTVMVTVPFKYANLTFMFQYYRKSTITMTGSVSARKALGIPYWADIAVSVSESIDTSLRFVVCVGGTIPSGGGDEEDFNHLSTYVAQQAGTFEDADNKFQTIKDSKSEGVNFDGSSLTIKLGTGRFPFGGFFDVFIDFNFVIKVQAEIMFGYTYTEHTTSTILSYNSGDDDPKGSNSVTELSSSSSDISLIGMLTIDVGLHFKFGVGVCGLEDYISLSIYADIGIYVTLGGYANWSWDDSPGEGDVRFYGSFMFEVGWYADVGIQLSLFFVDLSVNFAAIRQPFWTYGNDDFFLERPIVEDTLNIGVSGINFDDLHYLRVKHFCPTYEQVSIDEYTWNQSVKFIDDNGDMIEGQIFSFSFDHGDYVEFKDGQIIIKDNAPARFSDTLFIDVPEAIYPLKEGENHFLEVHINYFAEYARDIKFDGQVGASQYEGESITIPGEPEEREGFKFYGWKEVATGNVYAEGETYTIPECENPHDNPVEFESVYRVCFKVTFYDGENHIISEQSIADGDAAKEPSPEARDAQMPDNAIFVGWSTEFDEITCELEVYAIYMYVDEEA